jgi:ferredoxin-NADP reductase/ferredoxin
MEYNIVLTTRDGQVVQFSCNADEDIITAAERQQVLLPQQCRSGACGFCTATMIEGEYILRNYNDSVLTPSQKARKLALLCRTYPQSDLRISTPYGYKNIKFANLNEATVVVAEKQMLNSEVLFLALQQTDNLTNLLSSNAIAGQYVFLSSLDKKLKRAYSLINLANWDGRLEFLIKLWENGKFSQHWQNINCGDFLLATEPRGEFILQDNGLKPRWFVAGSTGLSPILAMLRQMVEFAEPHPSHLFFALRYEEDIFALNELQNLAQIMPNFSYQLCFSRPKTDKNTSSVIVAVESALQQLTEIPDIYICGSLRLVNGIVELAKNYNIPDSNLKFERFN